MKISDATTIPSPMAPLRVMALIKVLAECAEGLSLTQLAERIDTPKSSLVNLLRAMIEGGYVETRGKTYSLGAETYRISAMVSKTSRFPTNVHHLLKQLHKLSDETCLIGVPDDSWSGFIYVDILESTNLLRFCPKSGERRIMHKAAAGKILLAFGQGEKRDAYLEKLRVASPTAVGLASVKALVRELAAVREMGHSISHVSFPGVTGIMAPVVDARSEIVAAVGLAGPSERISGRLEEYVEMVVETARQMSKMQG